MKTVAVLGGTGEVGGHVMEVLLSRGHTVRCLARSPEKLTTADRWTAFLTSGQLVAVKGDGTSADSVKELVAGCDAVISALGNVAKALIMEKTYGNIVAAVSACFPSPPKLIVITTLGTSGTSWVVKIMLQMIGGRTNWADYEAADALVCNYGETSKRAIVLRPTYLTSNEKRGEYLLTQETGIASFLKDLTKADVACCFADLAVEKDWDTLPQDCFGKGLQVYNATSKGKGVDQ